jgi:hypothetical protein
MLAFVLVDALLEKFGADTPTTCARRSSCHRARLAPIDQRA